MTTDANTPSTPQAGAGGDIQPQAGTTSPAPQAGNGKQPLTPEEYERKLAEANREAASHRVELKRYKDAEEAAKLAAMGDLEKAQKRAETAEKQIQQYKEQYINAQVKLAAKDKGIIDPDMAALALHDKLEFGDDGMPTNLEKALEDLIKAKPYLVAKAGEATPTSPAQTANRAPQVPAMNPGRASIASPGQLAPNQVMRLTDVFKRNKP